MQDTMIIKEAVAAQFQKGMERGRIIFFSAPCGFGKTALAEALLSGRRVLRANSAAPDFSAAALAGNWEVMLLDDFQYFPEQTERQTLCEIIRENPERRFVLCSRGVPPGWLRAFEYAGLMCTLDAQSLLFDREDTKKLLRACDLPVNEAELTEMLKETSGYPLGLAITARMLRAKKAYTPELLAEGFREVFLYFETEVYQRFDLPVRRFLLELAPFESFDSEMACMVSGDARAPELLEWLQRYTTMMRYGEDGRIRFWPQFRRFLLWEMEREYTEEKRKALLRRGALYYELQGDFLHALVCYEQGGDAAKISELLVRNAELHPGMGHYSELERYYCALPEEEILASPALMQAMSMLCALQADYEGSERWYQALADFSACRSRQDAAGRQARGRLAWLDVSLPQRGVEALTKTIPEVYRLLRSGEVQLPAFSVTSALPSIMNGGKDFSDWSRRDDILYHTLRVPVEAVLGRDGVGLADCAIVESKFEKGEDISGRMLRLVSRLNELQQNGTPDLVFATAGLLARSQLAAGQADDARRTIETLRAQFARDALTRFLPNMDALLCRIALHTGDLEAVERWYHEKAPREPLQLNVLKRYQYFTQAMAELAGGRPEAALLTLAPLESYCEVCRRVIDGIQLSLLRAIALYRKKNRLWQKQLRLALQNAAQYGFVRTISVFGAAILPLLEEYIPAEQDDRWLKRVMADVRAQAAFYPAFLQPPLPPSAELTNTERQVLRLVCAGKSNAEICAILDIKLPTVKTHVSHIFAKLGINRRSEAEAAAKRCWLIE